MPTIAVAAKEMRAMPAAIGRVDDGDAGDQRKTKIHTTAP
jgi:hypothetical protein